MLYCFNSAPDPFNGQAVNFILKPPKLIESRTYEKPIWNTIETTLFYTAGHLCNYLPCMNNFLIAQNLQLELEEAK